MRKAKQLEPKKYPCPEPLYLRDKTIQRVAEWCRCTVFEAEALYEAEPARFNRYLGWADVESEAEPVAYAHADSKARKKAKLEGRKGAAGSLGAV